MKDIAIYCAGGFGREVYCIIFNRIKNSEWNFVGFFDDVVEQGTQLQYGPCLGDIDIINAWSTPLDVVIANGNPQMLKHISEGIRNSNVDFPNIIDPSCIFFDVDTLKMGKGNIFCIYDSFGINVELGDFNIFNCRINVGHEAKFGSCNALMPGVIVSGAVEIGDYNFFGSGSFIIQGGKVGSSVIVGANSTLLGSAKKEGTYVGTPAKILKY